ncbi:MAG: 4Fe-4S binding protein [Deltaproteobacteria bacterium]|nr:4Fe-4S binding protein [Deltaproteobacteria bacterium]
MTGIKLENKKQGTSKKLLVLALVSGLAAVGVFFLPLEKWKYWTFDYILFISVILIVPPILILEQRRYLRGLVLLFSLAYFGFLQASCPRLPGALELVLLHLTDKNPIAMHVVKVSVVLGTALLFGRYYCGWICPKGTIQDYLYRPELKIKVPERLDRILKNGKYLMLILLVSAPLLYNYQLFRKIGPFKVIFNLDGETVLIVFLAVVLVSSIFIERPYCRYFCPEGGLLALVSLLAPHKIRVNINRCTACNVCSKVCPTDAITARKKEIPKIAASECIFCMKCVDACKFSGMIYDSKSVLKGGGG